MNLKRSLINIRLISGQTIFKIRADIENNIIKMHI